MKLKDSNECSFCQGETEPLIHLFWGCPKVQQFVKEFLTYFKERYKKIIQINIASWFFLTELSDIDALIITLSKDVINKARINNSIPSLTAMMNSLKKEAETEYNACMLKNRVHVFESKWKDLATIIK